MSAVAGSVVESVFLAGGVAVITIGVASWFDKRRRRRRASRQAGLYQPGSSAYTGPTQPPAAVGMVNPTASWTGQAGQASPTPVQVFELRQPRFPVAVTQVLGLLFGALGLFFIVGAVFASARLEVLIVGLVFGAFGLLFGWLKRPIERQLIAVNHLTITFRPGFGPERQSHVREVAQLKASTSPNGGVVGRDLAGKTLFVADGQMVNYQLLLDWLQAVRPDLQIQ